MIMAHSQPSKFCIANVDQMDRLTLKSVLAEYLNPKYDKMSYKWELT